MYVTELLIRTVSSETREALEEKLGGKWPGDVCPYCGARAFRLERQEMHGRREVWQCGECQQKVEVRLDLVSPSARKASRIWRDRT
jgi:predicted SprT family Zn-dependent metalloprotease